MNLAVDLPQTRRTLNGCASEALSQGTRASALSLQEAVRPLAASGSLGERKAQSGNGR